MHLPIIQNVRSDVEAEKKKRDKIPKFACSTCTISSECPEYKEGYVCAFNDAFKAFDIRGVDNVMELMLIIANKNKERLMRAFFHEEIVSGGQLDPMVSRQSELVMQQLRQLIDLSIEVKKVNVSFHGQAAQMAAGTHNDKGGAGGPGILSRLFGGNDQKPADLQLNMPDADVTAQPAAEPVVVEAEPAHEEEIEVQGESEDFGPEPGDEEFDAGPETLEDGPEDEEDNTGGPA